jgi:hypothetical protein
MAARIEVVKKIHPIRPPRLPSLGLNMYGTTTFQTVEKKKLNMNPMDWDFARRRVDETSPAILMAGPTAGAKTRGMSCKQIPIVLMVRIRLMGGGGIPKTAGILRDNGAGDSHGKIKGSRDDRTGQDERPSSDHTEEEKHDEGTKDPDGDADLNQHGCMNGGNARQDEKVGSICEKSGADELRETVGVKNDASSAPIGALETLQITDLACLGGLLLFVFVE